MAQSTKTPLFHQILQEIEQSIRPEVPVQALHKAFSPFENLSVEQQVIVFNYTQRWLKILKTMQHENENWLDSRKLLRTTCRILNLNPPEEIFNRVDPDDIVEIYNSNGLQIFRSFNLFLRTKHSIETMLCSSWEKLTERDPSVTIKIWEKVQAFLQDRKTFTAPWGIESHLIYETFQEKKHAFLLELKWVSAFLDEHDEVTFISTGKLKRLG
jgi:hypothetical protein